MIYREYIHAVTSPNRYSAKLGLA